MAIAPTGNIFKGFELDGESSKDYGVYITGEAVYNAPERDVEMISIPGRSGAFALDRGRFENIEVTYPAGIFADNETDFAEAISEFRNYLCSRRGYCRLIDDYNPNEFRMAIYKSGLEVEPAQLKAGEFEIVFDCKPQRFLTEGETPIEVGDGATITNPTRFESSPILEVEGYGSIGINGETITIEDVDVGMIPVTDASSLSGTPDSQATFTVTIPLDDTNINGPDSIYVSGVECIVEREIDPGYSGLSASVTSVTDATGTCNATGEVMRARLGAGSFISAGTGSNIIGTVNYSVSYTYNGSRSSNSFTITIIATRVSGGIEVEVTAGGIEPLTVARSITISVPVLYAYSSNSALGNPTYIDLDLGAAWNADSGVAVSLNNAVQLPAKLPTLKVGANLISFDSNITDLKVVPRWWKI